MQELIDIKSMLPSEIEAEFKQLGLPAYRAKQVFQWLSKGVRIFDEMSNLPAALRQRLSEIYYIDAPQVLSKQVSKLDGTIKYLWQLRDGNSVESVIMRYKYGNTICISSQVGCAMGCAFCASTIGGLVRNLTPSEILDQVMFSQLDSGVKINNIVLMGIGEPLANMENVLRFLELVNLPEGLNVGMRHITLSTCGLTEKVDKLAQRNIQLTLTVSLHAPDDETRSKIMPVNKAYGVEKVMKACRDYYKSTGRRVSFEYAMIDGVNDTERHANLLVGLIGKAGFHVNLIPLNDVRESPLKPSKPENMKRFTDILSKNGINFTIRRKLGGDIDASCGQLRRKTLSLG